MIYEYVYVYNGWKTSRFNIISHFAQTHKFIGFYARKCIVVDKINKNRILHKNLYRQRTYSIHQLNNKEATNDFLIRCKLHIYYYPFNCKILNNKFYEFNFSFVCGAYDENYDYHY